MCVLRVPVTTPTKATMMQTKSIVAQQLDGVVDEVAV